MADERARHRGRRHVPDLRPGANPCTMRLRGEEGKVGLRSAVEHVRVGNTLVVPSWPPEYSVPLSNASDVTPHECSARVVMHLRSPSGKLG